VKRSTIAQIEAEIARGGGITARALIVGTRQEKWIKLHERFDKEEIETAIVKVLTAACGHVDNAAAYLNVRPEFLLRYANRRAVATVLGEKLVELDRRAAGPLAPWAWPETAGAVRPIIVYRSPDEHTSCRGAWRVEDMLADERSHGAAVEVLRELAVDARTTVEIAKAWNCSRSTLWKWRKTWTDVDDIVEPRVLGGSPDLARLRVNRKLRLTPGEAIDLVLPLLPILVSEFDARFTERASSGALRYPVKITRSELIHNYLKVPDGQRRMLCTVMKPTENGPVRVFTLIDTKTGAEIVKDGVQIEPPRKRRAS
jgi:hypothetical protein